MESLEVLDLKSKIRQLINVIELLKQDLPVLEGLIDKWIEEITEDKKDASL